MIRLFIFTMVIVGNLLPFYASAQGIRMDSQPYSSKGKVISAKKGGITESYSQDKENKLLERLNLGIKRADKYMNINNISLPDRTYKLDSRDSSLNSDMSLSTKKTSKDYSKKYQKMLKGKTAMIARHKKEREEQGNTLNLVTAQLQELMDYTKKSEEIRKLAEETYKQEIKAIEEEEIRKFEEDSRNNLIETGAPLPESVRYRRKYDRILKDIKDLKKQQYEDMRNSKSSFDRDARHGNERKRLNKALRKARKELDAQLAKERVKK